MNERSKDDFDHERQALDAAHAQNEAGRDSFIALAHTALFAASVSFVGEVAPIGMAIFKPVLLLGWAADVVGLLALTFSFGAARRAIDARRVALNDPNPPTNIWAERLNGISLWSFPVALLCLFSFVTANVVHVDERQTNLPSSVTTIGNGRSDTSSEGSLLRDERRESPTKSANTSERTEALDRRNSSAAITRTTPSSSATSSKDISAK